MRNSTPLPAPTPEVGSTAVSGANASGEMSPESLKAGVGFAPRAENGRVTGLVVQPQGDGVEVGGGCGKAGQSPLPVSNGSPHIRIQNCLVSGA